MITRWKIKIFKKIINLKTQYHCLMSTKNDVPTDPPTKKNTMNRQPFYVGSLVQRALWRWGIACWLHVSANFIHVFYVWKLISAPRKPATERILYTSP